MEILSWRQRMRLGPNAFFNSQGWQLLQLLMLIVYMPTIYHTSVDYATMAIMKIIKVERAPAPTACYESCRSWDPRLLYMTPANDDTDAPAKVYVCHEADFLSDGHAARLVDAYGPVTRDPALLNVIRDLAALHEKSAGSKKPRM